MTAVLDGAFHRMSIVALALFGCTSITTAQEWKRWIEQLGDTEHGDAAERALVDFGEKSVPGLQQVFESWDVSTSRDTDRLFAALRVVDMLGAQAQELEAQLVTMVISSNGKILRGPRKRVMLAPLLHTIGSLTPYADGTEFHTLFHNAMVGASDKEKPAVFHAIYRYRQRRDSAATTIEDARAKLAADRIFAREVAAETMHRVGERTDAVLLRDRLLDRERRPKGWDALKHNGFVVPCEDDFALQAARALVHIAPDDAISAIGYAVIGSDHPWRTRRIEALRALARFGPDIAAAIPELIEVASGDDAELAAEAIKALGMAGKAVGLHLATIDGLCQDDDPRLAKYATSLAARLRAMGCTVTPADPEIAAAAARQRAMVVAVDALADTESDVVAAAEALLTADADLAFPLLVDRFRREFHDCPDRVLEWIAQSGRSRPRQERETLCHSLAMTGNQWSGPSFSSSAGGSKLRDSRRDAYGALWIGSPAEISELVDYLDDPNTVLRLAAARALLTRDEVARSGQEDAQQALWQAVIADHPKKITLETGPRQHTTLPFDLGYDIRTTAAAALHATDQPVDRHAQLLHHALHHANAIVVTKAIVAWGEHAEITDLEQAAQDERAKVAAAAKNAIARRDQR